MSGNNIEPQTENTSKHLPKPRISNMTIALLFLTVLFFLGILIFGLLRYFILTTVSLICFLYARYRDILSVSDKDARSRQLHLGSILLITIVFFFFHLLPPFLRTGFLWKYPI
ncbi:MAG: hypothetical protein J5750_04340, partial [Clostridiales bacterium]|nr:hypothetical protein [Clostridiales bacterium]